MVSLNELLNDLNLYLQVNLFEDFCPNGLQIEGTPEVKNIALAVSASLNVINEARDYDALIVHHGLFWMKDSYVIKGIKREKIKTLLDSNTSLIAYHLPLDAHPEVGNNYKAAIDLGWRNLAPFGKIGVKGIFDPLSVSKFQTLIEAYYGQKAHAILGGDEVISSAALISGGAHKELPHAKEAGVQAYITGSFDEPSYHQSKEEKIHFFACGHAATEKIGIKALGDYIAKKWKVKCHFIDEANPF